MTRDQLLVPLVCLVAMGGGLFFWKATPRSAPLSMDAPLVSPKRSTKSQSTDEHPAEISSEVPGALDGPIEQISPISAPSEVEGNSTDRAQIPSSWEDPFAAEKWRSKGWTFTAAGMRSQAAGISSATFFRPYQKLMFECDMRADPAAQGTWELRLATRENQAMMSLIIHTDRISVVGTENGLNAVLVQKPLPVPLSADQARQIRVVATGNRIVISWDGRRLLTTEQLATQSGREIVWSLHTQDAEFTIPRMRIEGD